MVRPAVRTNPSRIRSFSKALFKPEEFEKAGFRFRVNGKNFENEAFRKPWCYDNLVISLTEFSSSTNLKWLVIVMFLNFSGIVWTKNIWRALKTRCHLPWCITGKQLNRGPRNSHFYAKPWLERKSVSIVLFIVGVRSCLSVFQLHSFSSSAFAIFWNNSLGLVVISFGYYLWSNASQEYSVCYCWYFPCKYQQPNETSTSSFYREKNCPNRSSRHCPVSFTYFVDFLPKPRSYTQRSCLWTLRLLKLQASLLLENSRGGTNRGFATRLFSLVCVFFPSQNLEQKRDFLQSYER